MTSSKTWQASIASDIQRLKELKPDIVPGIIFYGELFKLMLCFYAIIVGIPFLLLPAFSPVKSWMTSFYTDDLWYLSILFLVVSVFFLPKMATYITFKKTIKDHLELGSFIHSKVKGMCRLFAVIYFLWVMFDTLFLFSTEFQHLGERMITVFVGTIAGTLITAILIEMELARAGIAVLFSLISVKNNNS